MKKYFLILFITATSFSQIKFENGYYINNSDVKVECLINNIDWKNNPKEIQIKNDLNDDLEVIGINSIKEFGVYGSSKFERHMVEIDKSSTDLNKIDNERNPVFVEEQLFLKVFVEGKATLYYYEDGNLFRFFFKVGDLAVKQLVYKTYIIDSEKKYNFMFRQQLSNAFSDNCKSNLKTNDLNYSKKELTNLFEKYNECVGSESLKFFKREKTNININLRPGFKSSSLLIENEYARARNVDFGKKSGFRFGVETEIILPYNKNKWGIIIEPTYQYYKSEIALNTEKVTADYKSIELPIGLRHYFFINENSKIFMNLAYVFDMPLSSKIDYERSDDLDVNTRNNMIFGIGFNKFNRFSLELRIGTSRHILGGYLAWSSKYNTSSLILGYKIF